MSRPNGEVPSLEPAVQEALEFLRKLVQHAVDFASVEVKPQLVGRDENPEDAAFDNTIEVAVPAFVNQPVL